jgi:hypothetical protein
MKKIRLIQIIKEEYNKEKIRSLIRQELKEILAIDEESEAAKKAKSKGLVSKGFGNWADPKTGEVVATTKDGQLNPVGGKEESPKKKRGAKTSSAKKLIKNLANKSYSEIKNINSETAKRIAKKIANDAKIGEKQGNNLWTILKSKKDNPTKDIRHTISKTDSNIYDEELKKRKLDNFNETNMPEEIWELEKSKALLDTAKNIRDKWEKKGTYYDEEFNEDIANLENRINIGNKIAKKYEPYIYAADIKKSILDGENAGEHRRDWFKDK